MHKPGTTFDSPDIPAQGLNGDCRTSLSSAEEGRPAVGCLHLASGGCPAANALLAAVNSATLLNGFTWIELGHYIRNRRLRKGLWTLIISVVIGYFLNEV